MNWEEAPRLTMVLDLPGQYHSKLPNCFCYLVLLFIYFVLFRQRHPVNRAPFCLLFDRGREKEALPESCQAFEGSTAQSSGLVNLVLYRQTSFSSVSIRLLINQ